MGKEGECKKNPNFMKHHCKSACGWCEPRNKQQEAHSDTHTSDQQGSAFTDSVGHPKATAADAEAVKAPTAEAVSAALHPGHEGSGTKMKAQLAALDKARQAARQIQEKLKEAREAGHQVGGWAGQPQPSVACRVHE